MPSSYSHLEDHLEKPAPAMAAAAPATILGHQLEEAMSDEEKPADACKSNNDGSIEQQNETLAKFAGVTNASDNHHDHDASRGKLEEVTIDAAIHDPTAHASADGVVCSAVSDAAAADNVALATGIGVTSTALQAAGGGMSRSTQPSAPLAINGTTQPPTDGLHRLNTEALSQKPMERQRIRAIVEHLAFRVVALLCIVADIGVLLVALFGDPEPTTAVVLEYVSLVFSLLFVVEISLRIYAVGSVEFFSKWYNKVDFVIVILTLLISLIEPSLEAIHAYARAVVVGRLVRAVGFVRFVRLYGERRHVVRGARHVVSENKRRYRAHGFDLDLVYVTSRVVAMSYPSSGNMAWYRNPIQEVERFFKTMHAGHYRVCNMCSERTYDDSRFEGRIMRLSIDDHNVPLLGEAVEFVKQVQAFLDSDPTNVIAIHCKGGKGRTGTLICMILLNNNVFESAKESLQYFGEVRTDLTVGTKFQGVETPSQNRYVEYFERIKNDLSMIVPAPVPMKVTHIRIRGINGFGRGNGSDLRCEVFEARQPVFDMVFGEYRNCRVVHDAEGDILTVTPVNFPVVRGDVKFRFRSSVLSVPKGYENCAFFFWFYTSFIENDSLSLHRNFLDNPHKKKTWTTFGDNFVVELNFVKM